jgi:hypothetical protein
LVGNLRHDARCAGKSGLESALFRLVQQIFRELNRGVPSNELNLDRVLVLALVQQSYRREEGCLGAIHENFVVRLIALKIKLTGNCILI